MLFIKAKKFISIVFSIVIFVSKSQSFAQHFSLQSFSIDPIVRKDSIEKLIRNNVEKIKFSLSTHNIKEYDKGEFFCNPNNNVYFIEVSSSQFLEKPRLKIDFSCSTSSFSNNLCLKSINEFWALNMKAMPSKSSKTGYDICLTSNHCKADQPFFFVKRSLIGYLLACSLERHKALEFTLAGVLPGDLCKNSAFQEIVALRMNKEILEQICISRDSMCQVNYELQNIYILTPTFWPSTEKGKIYAISMDKILFDHLGECVDDRWQK